METKTKKVCKNKVEKYIVFGTSGGGCRINFAPTKALRHDIEVPVTIVKSSTNYFFNYDNLTCATIAPECDPAYQKNEKSTPGNVMPKEKIYEILEKTDLEKVTCKILKLNFDATYTIEISIHKTKQKVSTNPFDIAPLIKGRRADKKAAILSRVEYIKKNSSATDFYIYLFAKELLEKEKEFVDFKPKYNKDKKVLNAAIQGAICGRRLDFREILCEDINTLINDMSTLCNVKNENVSISINLGQIQ